MTKPCKEQKRNVNKEGSRTKNKQGPFPFGAKHMAAMHLKEAKMHAYELGNG
jgi:hypothetical protein